MIAMLLRAVTSCLLLLATSCAGGSGTGDSGRTPAGRQADGQRDSAASVARFTAEMAKLLIDTTRFEMRGTLAVKRVNPNRDDESPLADEFIRAGAPPGPHTYDGVFYADLDVLRGLLDPTRRVHHAVEEDRVYVGRPEVLLRGHRHGEALFVPVRLYARQFAAYVDVRGTLGTMAIVWTPEIIAHSKRIGLVHSAGVIEGFAEGLVDSVDVRAPYGW